MVNPFLAAFIRSPKQMGAIAPSGAPLARAMAAQVPTSARTVLELGPGTGAITRALITRRTQPHRLMLIEKEPALASALARRFPQAEVLIGDAAYLTRLVHGRGAGPFDTVVSSLPLLAMHSVTAVKTLMQIFAVLGPGGTLVQYTYAPFSPIPRRLAERLDLDGTRVVVILRNIPPASVWVYLRPCPPAAAAAVRAEPSVGESQLGFEAAS